MNQYLICKCGGELRDKMIGDESWMICKDCRRIWAVVEDWMVAE